MTLKGKMALRFSQWSCRIFRFSGIWRCFVFIRG